MTRETTRYAEMDTMMHITDVHNAEIRVTVTLPNRQQTQTFAFRIDERMFEDVIEPQNPIGCDMNDPYWLHTVREWIGARDRLARMMSEQIAWSFIKSMEGD